MLTRFVNQKLIEFFECISSKGKSKACGQLLEDFKNLS
jgi:hypothetical protein